MQLPVRSKRRVGALAWRPGNSYTFFLQYAALGVLKSSLEFAPFSYCLQILFKSYHLGV